MKQELSHHEHNKKLHNNSPRPQNIPNLSHTPQHGTKHTTDNNHHEKHKQNHKNNNKKVNNKKKHKNQKSKTKRHFGQSRNSKITEDYHNINAYTSEDAEVDESNLEDEDTVGLHDNVVNMNKVVEEVKGFFEDLQGKDLIGK